MTDEDALEVLDPRESYEHWRLDLASLADDLHRRCASRREIAEAVRELVSRWDGYREEYVAVAMRAEMERLTLAQVAGLA